MSVDEPAGSAANPLDWKYLSGLLDHISATQDHLDGNDGTPFSPSFLPPNALWTAQEKDSFFHALSAHSRLRPDLISHEIKTKSVQDVCNYLSVLHAAASQQETTIPYLQWRQDLPIAMEVSSEWVAMEEEKAVDLTAREQDWQHELTAEQRRVETKLLKKASRAGPHEMGPSQRKAALKQQIANADLRARREDFCGSLGSPELSAISIILREATDFSDLGQIKQPSVLHTPTPQCFTGHVEGLEATQILPFSATNGAGDISGVDITVRLTPFSTAADMQNPSNKGSDEGSSLKKARPPPTPPKQASMADLSPASRRRYQKRLHMRRKRASTSGVTAIDDSLERLKPGRRKVKRSPSPEDEENNVSAGGADEPSVTQRRLPRAKKIALNELQGLGLTADDLGRSGVDVLNLEGVAKMLKYVAYRLTSPTPFLMQPVCGTNCLETPLAMVQGFLSRQSSYSTFMWAALSKMWLIERSPSGNRN